MDNSVPLIKFEKEYSKAERIKHWLNKQIIGQKLYNPFGFALLIIYGLVLGVVVSQLDKAELAPLMGAIIGLPLAFLIIFNLSFGLAFLVSISFFILGVKKVIFLPFGLAVDISIALMLFGLLIKQIRLRDWSFMKSPITTFFVLWFIYYLMQFANPIAPNRLAWFYVVRGMAGLNVLFFISLFALKDLKVIKRMVILIIGLSMAVALYGFKQEHLGLSGWETKWLHSDIKIYKLIYQWGRIRVFSFLSDPSTYGILMGLMSVFCFILGTAPYATWKRVVLFVSSGIFVVAMTYSGTRTAVFIVPAGFFLFALISMNKRIIAITGLVLVLGSAVMMKSTSNPVIYRVQSTFKLGDDPSMNNRLSGQQFIQPFIRSHPFGAGLGTTGSWGQRFSPHTWLAQFAPDSGFVRIGAETGWFGLLFYCTMIFFFLMTGIRNYFRARDAKIKNMIAAFLVMIFMTTIATYPQDALQIPISNIYIIAIACLVELHLIDKKLWKEKLEKESLQA